MSSLFGDTKEGKMAYKACVKQTWDKLKTLREVIAKSAKEDHETRRI